MLCLNSEWPFVRTICAFACEHFKLCGQLLQHRELTSSADNKGHEEKNNVFAIVVLKIHMQCR